DDRSRVDAHAYPELETVTLPHLALHCLEALLHREGGAQRPAGMVLTRDVTEEGHDAVTQKLVDCPVMLVHDLQHDVEGPVHDLADLLWVELLGHCGEARDVREEHGDLFALTPGPQHVPASPTVVSAG